MSRRLEVEIIGDSRSLERAFGRASNAGTGFGKALKGLGIAAGVATAAIAGGFIYTLKRGFDELSDGQKVAAQTAAVLKSTGHAANVSQKHIEGYASALAKVIPIDDEVIQAGQNVLLSFENIRNEVGKGNDIFDRATKIAADYAARTGKDMSQAALIFGKALEDPLKKSSALARAGIILSDSQKEQIKAFVESGKSIEAQKVLLAALEERYKGAGEAAGKTLAGQLEIAKNQFDEMASKVAVKFLPILTQALAWVNDHWPEISAVFEAVAVAVEKSIRVIGVVINFLIPYFKRLADFSRKHWGEVQEAADRVVKWYQGTLAPVIRNVLTAITAFWNRFGKDITKIVQTSLGQVWTIISTVLKNISSVVNAMMAVLRGDWSTAWNELKEIPGRSLRAIVSLIRGMATIFYTAMAAIGRAMIDGVISGLSGLLGAVKDKIVGGIMGAIGAAGNKLHGSGPFQFTNEAVGVPLGQGVLDGLSKALGAMPTVMADKIKAGIEAGAAAIESSKSRFSEAFDALASTALSAFDKMASEIETKSEKKLRLMDERARKQQLEGDITAAGTALTAAQSAASSMTQGEGESAEDYAARAAAANQAVLDAQQVLDDALAAKQRANLEERAKKEREDLDNRLGLKRRHFEEELGALNKSYSDGKISAKIFHERLLALFNEYHVPYKKGSKQLGLALAEGLTDAFVDVQKAAKALAQEILDQFSKIRVIINVDLSVKDGNGNKPDGRARGGYVQGNTAYIVGEAGPELFVPSQSGTIIPNGGGGMGAGGGAPVINISFPNYLGSKDEVVATVRDGLLQMQRRGVALGF